MRVSWKVLVLVVCLSVASSLVTWFILHQFYSPETSLLSPLLEPHSPTKPLQAYSIPNLSQRSYVASTVKVEKVLAATDSYTSYLFSYTTLGKRVTGQLNLPKQTLPGNPAIIMLRGYVPPEIYQTGIGTKNAAAFFAQHGYITAAPDFFGFGGSDPEPGDTWQARFEKPIIVIELLKSLATNPVLIAPEQLDSPPPQLTKPQTISVGKIGLWGHSNGGQIALSTLEILGTSVPTTLWAPVTAPFPYSILFFSDEHSDEGKEMRQWLAMFERDYDVFDFSLTQHLDRLQGPLQLHHGTADEASLKTWSDEFEQRIKTENSRRVAAQKTATHAASIDQSMLQPIDLTYYIYPGANHNLQPGWQTVVERDLEFFNKHLAN